MPALMKAFPNITAHYRSGSHTIFRRMANVNICYSVAYSQVPLAKRSGEGVRLDLDRRIWI